jgi:hypothetical protein
VARAQEPRGDRGSDPQDPEARAHALEARVNDLEEDTGDLMGRVEKLEEQAKEIAQKADLARAAERGWKALHEAREHVIFRSDAGQIARLPVNLVRLLARNRPIDLAVTQGKDGQTIRYTTGEGQGEPGDDVVGEIPKSLWVVLEKVLNGTVWSKPPARESQSHEVPRETDETPDT